MPTQVLCLDVFDPLHIFPLDIYFTFQDKDNNFGLHGFCVLMQLKELVHSKYLGLCIFYFLQVSIRIRWIYFLKLI